MKHFDSEVSALEQSIAIYKAKLNDALKNDRPFSATKRILRHIRSLETTLATVKAAQPKAV